MTTTSAVSPVCVDLTLSDDESDQCREHSNGGRDDPIVVDPFGRSYYPIFAIKATAATTKKPAQKNEKIGARDVVNDRKEIERSTDREGQLSLLSRSEANKTQEKKVSEKGVADPSTAKKRKILIDERGKHRNNDTFLTTPSITNETSSIKSKDSSSLSDTVDNINEQQNNNNAEYLQAKDTATSVCVSPHEDLKLAASSSDNDVMMIDKADVLEFRTNPKLSESTENKEDELEIVGTVGQNALVDFPHSRENCAVYKFRLHKNAAIVSQVASLCNSNEKVCDNCFCYVCDILASKCKQWKEHCHASHSLPSWRKERQRAKRYGLQNSRPPTGCITNYYSRSQPWSSSSSFRSGVETQDLRRTAGMNDQLEGDSWLEPYKGRDEPQDASLLGALKLVTSVHPVEAEPPTHKFITKLRHYQKQSLAFMKEIEESTDQTLWGRNSPRRGGWLCDEVGMGKSAVVIALITSNPLRSEGLMAKQKSRSFADSPTRVKVKATVIFTSITLVGQWMDEFHRHAPSLKVARYHRTKPCFLYNHSKIHELDAIITTGTFRWCEYITNKFEFHRIVIDESHLLEPGFVSFNSRYVEMIRGERRWCVTGTPSGNGNIGTLTRQMDYMGISPFNRHAIHQELPLQRVIRGWMKHMKDSADCEGKTTMFHAFVDIMKTFMIAHSKNQQIMGESALALPKRTVTTAFVDMDPQEVKFYKSMNASIKTIERCQSQGISPFGLDRFFDVRLPKPGFLVNLPKDGLIEEYKHNCKTNYRLIYNKCAKINFLREELKEMRGTEPNLKVVVFTKYVPVHDAIVRALRDDFTWGQVLDFKGSTDSLRRDRIIREFQTSCNQPMILVITIQTGNVGITLTAASRVYLMEPSIDPAVEVQAAGRIHRLGQTKSVQVKRLVFRDSYEQNILELQEKIVSGEIQFNGTRVPPEAVQILAKGMQSRDGY